MSEYEDLIARCAREAAKVWTSENKQADIVQAGILFQPTARAVLAEVMRTLENVTPEMARAFDDAITRLGAGDTDETWTGAIWPAMLRASPLAEPPK